MKKHSYTLYVVKAAFDKTITRGKFFSYHAPKKKIKLSYVPTTPQDRYDLPPELLL